MKTNKESPKKKTQKSRKDKKNNKKASRYHSWRSTSKTCCGCSYSTCLTPLGVPGSTGTGLCSEPLPRAGRAAPVWNQHPDKQKCQTFQGCCSIVSSIAKCEIGCLLHLWKLLCGRIKRKDKKDSSGSQAEGTLRNFISGVSGSFFGIVRCCRFYIQMPAQCIWNMSGLFFFLVERFLLECLIMLTTWSIKVWKLIPKIPQEPAASHGWKTRIVTAPAWRISPQGNR